MAQRFEYRTADLEVVGSNLDSLGFFFFFFSFQLSIKIMWIILNQVLPDGASLLMMQKVLKLEFQVCCLTKIYLISIDE